ncbi:MAG: nucleotidyltransferase family protein [Burkholderiales bacterium]|nr:nucleotidyltransferase family protein [Burkholderiales bacterium]
MNVPSLAAQKLKALIRRNKPFMSWLHAVRTLGLSSWCIGAGAVRNVVWDSLSGHAAPSMLADVDVAYFDAADISAERDAQLQRALQTLTPTVPWEVTNQAGVHQWFESVFGRAVAPLHSLEDAIATWPEFVTCIGVTLTDDDEIRVIAPHGSLTFDDLFSMTIRHNPVRATVANYNERVAKKNYAARWPSVTILPAQC